MRERCDGTNCKGHPLDCYGHPNDCGCTPSAPRAEITEEEPRVATLSPLLSDLYQSIAERDAEIARLTAERDDAIIERDTVRTDTHDELAELRAENNRLRRIEEAAQRLIVEWQSGAGIPRRAFEALRDALAAEPQRQTGEAG